jgi:hypothetical protein
LQWIWPTIAAQTTKDGAAEPWAGWDVDCTKFGAYIRSSDEPTEIHGQNQGHRGEVLEASEWEVRAGPRLAAGHAPEDRKNIGGDIQRVECEWPIGMPLVKSISSGLLEIRSSLPSKRLARTFFAVDDGKLILLHGFIKTTQKTLRPISILPEIAGGNGRARRRSETKNDKEEPARG